MSNDTETTHQCPPEGSGLMPCCGRTPFEVSWSDRLTMDLALVTCHDLAYIKACIEGAADA